MYEVLDDTAAQVILALESGDSIRRVAQHLHTPYETVRQAVNRLEDAGFVEYDDGLSVVDDRVRNAARELVIASAGVSPLSIGKAYVIPQFGDWPFAFTRIDPVYVWTQGGYQVGRDPEDYPLFLAVREQDVDDRQRENLDALATEITESVDIRLEYEAHYDWVAFVPQRESDAGALTKYFGKVAGEDEFKVRGIEARQRSTPPFIADVQRDCLSILGETRSAEAVISRLKRAIQQLHSGTVNPDRLVERNRVSKPVEAYTQYTQNVAALERASDQDIAIHPGQDVEYVVVDDQKSSRERVALTHESIDTYDSSYYETAVIRAGESVLSPIGWNRTAIKRILAESRNAEITGY